MIKLLYGLLGTLVAVDWLQTLKIAHNPDKWYEAWNMILPKHPTVMQVNLYFLAIFAVISALIVFVPVYAPYITAIAAFIEIAAVVNNFEHGLNPF